jgi:hypothetical protein
MSVIADFVIASFTAPEQIQTNPQSALWLLPLVAAIALAYKATKLTPITAATFIKEAVVLFSSIVVFIIATALVLYALMWLIVM